MKQPSVVLTLILVGIIGLTSVSPGQQQSPVPLLPDTPFDYVEYAVTNLPEHYLPSGPFGDAGGANNTPSYNPITNDGATLGRVLFYDKQLSLNNSISCASCHTQETGFGDVRRFSSGYAGQLTFRHSMTLTNAMFYFSGRFRWDESAKSLESQCLIPIRAEDEMGLPMDQLRDRLSATPFYESLFVNAFGSGEVTDQRIAFSLAQFVRSMVSYNSKYDEAYALGDEEGFPDFDVVFTKSERLGQKLFERTEDSIDCHTCHGSPAQVANEVHNIGLDLTTIDPGAGNGRFKVTSLRNVAVRGRYMHDGRFTSLEEVINFYNSEIQPHPHLDDLLLDPNGDPIRFDLTDIEQQALIDFLNTLTDEQFLTDPKFSDPFAVRLGDLNRDGFVNQLDIPLFVERVILGSYQLEADINQDQQVNLADVQPFVDILSGD